MLTLPGTSQTFSFQGVPRLKAKAADFVARALMLLVASRTLVEQDRLDAICVLKMNRLKALSLLGEYQAFKHLELFDPAMACARRSIAARQLKVECILMGDLYGAFCARWDHADPASEWPAYRADMLATTEKLIVHIEAEQSAIAELLV
jgi:hypothetical protein